MDTTRLRDLQNEFETSRAKTPDAQELYKKAEDLIFDFQRKFDRKKIMSMTLDEYILGKESTDSYCYWIAIKTREVGNIAVGGAGRSFGVYYNKEEQSYMITEGAKSKKATKKEAETYLEKIKIGLIALLDGAGKKDLKKILTTSKELPLNQQAIGKTLSLFFPDEYLSIFSENHVNIFLDNLDLLDKNTQKLNIVKRRGILLDYKLKDEIFKNWPNRKYVDFLYWKMFDAQNGYIINTHPIWFKSIVEDKDLHDDFVFWGKSSRLPTKSIRQGTHMFFRLTRTEPPIIGGYGVVTDTKIMKLGTAWNKFGKKLGYPSVEAIIKSSSKFTGQIQLSKENDIYCILLKALKQIKPVNVEKEVLSLGIVFDSKHIVTGKKLSKDETKKLLTFLKLDFQKDYFILRTGGGEYIDLPDKKYNFKKGIPGYKQLLNAEKNAKFVYIEKKQFYGKGAIGKIVNDEKDGTTYYDAEILEYQKIEPPVEYEEVKSNIVKPLTQAGIMKISKKAYEAIVNPSNNGLNYLSANLDLSIDELSFNDLIFEPEEELKSSIHAALMSGKHIMFIGPPGTGKTEIARLISEIAAKKNYIDSCILTTATSDWTTFDTIGGYVPVKDGQGLEFMAGQFLRCFKEKEKCCNRWLIIDEINRADIDKAFGQLFTVLSGQNVDLPFEIEDKNIKIIAYKKWNKEKTINSNEYVLPNSWRLLATLNTYDKASLYQMSYAFMRRFAFINIGVPSDNFIDDNWDVYLKKWKLTSLLSEEQKPISDKIKDFWKSMNQSCRKLGPAIIKDMLEFLSKYKKPKNSNTNDIMAVLISTFVLPQFEGLEEKDLKDLEEKLKTFCNFDKIECLFDEMFK